MRVLETSRLILRPPTLADADAVYREYATDPEVVKYLTWKTAERVEETRSHMADQLAKMARGETWPWVITQRREGRLLGMIELRTESGGFAMSFGYVLARPAWGHGYMTEALAAVLAFAFENPAIYRVWAIHDVDNPASGRVMEKAGMRREGVLRRAVRHPNVSDEPRDAVLWAQVR